MEPNIETTAIGLTVTGDIAFGILPSAAEDPESVFPSRDIGSFGDSPAYEMPPFDLSPFGNESEYNAFNPFGDITSVEDGPTLNCSEQLKFYNEIKTYFSPSQIIVPIIYCVICLVGLIGNGLVMFVIIGSKEMTKSVANIYILNLAIADTLFLVTLPFSSTQRVLLSWPFGVGMCKIVEAIKYLNYFASIFFLTAMSLDRYFAVVYVVTSSRYRTNRNTFFVCLLVWLLSFVMVIPLLIYTKLHGQMCALVFNTNDFSESDVVSEDYIEYEDGELCPGYYSPDYITGYPTRHSEGVSSGDRDYLDMSSYINGSADNNFLMCKHPNSPTFHIFIVFTFVIGFIVPFTVITLCYAMIVVRLLQPSETRSRSRQAERTRRKVTRMVVALVVVFFVCWLPFYVWHLVQIRGIHVSMAVCSHVRDFTFCLCFANSCLNPLLYTFLGHNFQERLRKSIAMSLRSFTFTTFTRYTSHTLSRADTGGFSKKMEATNHSEPPLETTNRININQLTQVPEEEPCLANGCDTNGNLQCKV
ncbi:somatostatin receptor type 2-like [Styela clava]|uniref:somatostatin receptor type 2-like n=1 Tax=Styela clava TaxID=7725 RepID=UPI001939CCEE|nr:somatostatin receptor type 2-like [Styela clava]